MRLNRRVFISELVIASLFLGISSAFSMECEPGNRLLRPALIGEENLKTWKDFKFSDPQAHNRENFQYIIHTFNVFNTDSVEKAFLQATYNPPLSLDRLYSVSLITHSKPYAYAPFGFILGIDYEKIIATSPFDVDSRHTYITDIDRMISAINSAAPIRSPNEIIHLTGERAAIHNEIVLRGSDKHRAQAGIIFCEKMISTQECWKRIHFGLAKYEKITNSFLRLLEMWDLPLIRIDL